MNTTIEEEFKNDLSIIRDLEFSIIDIDFTSKRARIMSRIIELKTELRSKVNKWKIIAENDERAEILEEKRRKEVIKICNCFLSLI